jgi:hypothetical protein
MGPTLDKRTQKPLISRKRGEEEGGREEREGEGEEEKGRGEESSSCYLMFRHI